MNNLIDFIKSLPNMLSLGSIEISDIEKAEKELNLFFAEDFKIYTKNFGAISAKGIELFGVVSNERLSTVENTIECRNKFLDFPKDMYIIEDLAIDAILVLQNSKGEVYEYIPGFGTKLINSNLLEYLSEKNN